MRTQRLVAIAAALAIAAGAAQTALLAQSNSLAGTAKDEAKKPYQDFTVRAREVKQGSIGASTTLDQDANFTLPMLSAEKYVVELVNKDGKVVCTEGPFDLAKLGNKTNVVIDCDKIPPAFWLLGAGAAAGVTAGIVAAGGPASGAQ